MVEERDEAMQQRIAAYVDGELPPAEAQAFERAMADDTGLRDAVDAQRRLRGRISSFYAPVADEPVPERLRAMLSEPQEAEIIDFAAARARRDRRRMLPDWRSLGSLAATLAVGVFAGQLLFGAGSGPVASRDGALIARAGLERALDVQLASAQPADAPIRVGVSFRDQAGSLCRTFDSASLAGIACRSDGDWKLRQAIAPDGGPQATQYRQAGSPAAQTMQAAQEMMAGAPLDAAAERKARDGGWK